MRNYDDGLMGLLQTPKRPEPGSAESDPDPVRRSSGKAFLITLVALIIPSGTLFIALKDRPGGIQIAAIVAYTLLIPYIASDRFLNLVPWDRLTCRRFLLVHCFALAIVYGITTGTLAAKPYLPPWFTTESRKGSFFDWCLIGILLALAFCECFWGSMHEGEEGSEV